MWYEKLDNPLYMTNLYDEVPLLEDVKIHSIDVVLGGAQVDLVLELPSFPDNVPKRRVREGYSKVSLQLSLFTIEEFNLVYKEKCRGSFNIGSITIEDTDDGLGMIIVGGVYLKVSFSSAFIQRVIWYK